MARRFIYNNHNVGEVVTTTTTTMAELSDLIHCLDAGNSSSYPGTGTLWTDVSSNAKHSTLVNCTYSDGAIVFNGTNSYSSGATITGKTASFTMEAVFKTANYANNGQFIYSNGSDLNGNGYGFSINQEGTTNGHFFLLYQGVAWYDTNIICASNTWYHVSVVVNSSRVSTVYWNGVTGYTSGSSTINTPTVGHFVGKNNYPAQRHFEGSIASVRMYNRELNSTEAAQVYNAHKR